MAPLYVIAVIFRLWFQLPIPTLVPIPSPTPVPTIVEVTLEATPEAVLNEVYDSLATTERSLRDLPDQLNNPGAPLLPNEGGATVFSYAKWLLSPTTADELFGFLSPTMVHVSGMVLITVVFSAVYLVIFIARFVIRFIVWIVRHIRMLLPF
jgi:hypothetical protein